MNTAGGSILRNHTAISILAIVWNVMMMIIVTGNAGGIVASIVLTMRIVLLVKCAHLTPI
jgi:preprotein translocase subunit SecD